MNAWLLETSVLAEMRAATKAGVSPTSEQLADFNAAYTSEEEYPGARIMSKAGDSADIAVQGVMTRSPNWLARYFGNGNTTYSEIQSAINEAERDPKIKQVTFTIDSPGGNTNGLSAIMDSIKGMTKPTTAFVTGSAASAAYGIASQADTIIASNRGDMIGSIGVAAAFLVDPDVVEVASTNAPNKRPDVTTEAGKDIVRETLDQIEAIFIDGIAAGRGVTSDKVKSDFGKGGMFTADNALKNGMIDAIEVNPRATTAGKTPTKEAEAMDLATLKAAHADVYQAAVNEGIAKERDRVSAHLIFGESSGAITEAVKACKDGTEMTQALTATYMTATAKKTQLDARAGDDITAAEAANNANQPGKTPNAADAFEAAADAYLAGA